MKITKTTLSLERRLWQSADPRGGMGVGGCALVEIFFRMARKPGRLRGPWGGLSEPWPPRCPSATSTFERHQLWNSDYRRRCDALFAAALHPDCPGQSIRLCKQIEQLRADVKEFLIFRQFLGHCIWLRCRADVSIDQCFAVRDFSIIERKGLQMGSPGFCCLSWNCMVCSKVTDYPTGVQSH